MVLSPVTPNDFKALINTDSTSLCTAFINTFIKLPYLIFRLCRYMVNPDGSVTDDLARNVCQNPCPPI